MDDIEVLGNSVVGTPLLGIAIGGIKVMGIAVLGSKVVLGIAAVLGIAVDGIAVVGTLVLGTVVGAATTNGTSTVINIRTVKAQKLGDIFSIFCFLSCTKYRQSEEKRGCENRSIAPKALDKIMTWWNSNTHLLE